MIRMRHTGEKGVLKIHPLYFFLMLIFLHFSMKNDLFCNRVYSACMHSLASPIPSKFKLTPPLLHAGVHFSVNASVHASELVNFWSQNLEI